MTVSIAANLNELPWPSSSDPVIMSRNFVKRFSGLPLRGEVKDPKKYWSSDYWPLKLGSINYRWNAPEPIGFGLRSPNLEQAKKMNLQELKYLSPSEKFDLWMGKYTYPLKTQVSKRASPQRATWEGICHGWAAAALNFSEPGPKILINPDGIKIPFGSSDIKALLSYYYAYYYNPPSTYQMGRRCNGRNYCTEDLNAGAFHIVLANKVGNEGSSFIVDIENGREVWNQVVFNYTSVVMADNLPPASNSASGTYSVMRIKTKMKVVFNIVQNSWMPSIGTNNQTYKEQEYDYDLDLDREGNIIGGEWISKNRPDFMWRVDPVIKFYGLFSELRSLL